MNYDRNKLLKMVAILTLLCVMVGMGTRMVKKNSMTLTEYADLHSDSAAPESSAEKNDTADEDNDNIPESEADNTDADNSASVSNLVGASLNSAIPADQRVLYTDGFYYEPLSTNLRRFITGVSYPGTAGTASKADDESPSNALESKESGQAPSSDEDNTSLEITYEDLRYVHIWHYDFNGEPAEGELICNQAIAQDLVEIFYELYRNEYQIEKVHLIDEYDGDDNASMEDNNTSCFNYRLVEGSASLSKHALGLAIDINPLYNPYITYQKDGSENVSPVSAQPYADRNASFPYKIDQNDLCCRLFKEHGFTWGGDWNSSKDYQHFQKAVK